MISALPKVAVTLDEHLLLGPSVCCRLVRLGGADLLEPKGQENVNEQRLSEKSVYYIFRRMSRRDKTKKARAYKGSVFPHFLDRGLEKNVSTANPGRTSIHMGSDFSLPGQGELHGQIRTRCGIFTGGQRWLSLPN